MAWADTQLRHFKDPHSEAQIFSSRVLFASIVVSTLFFLLLMRFYSLQVKNYQDYATRADSNRIQLRPVPPNRGLIFDVNGVLLADNKPGFNLEIVVERVANLEATLNEIDALIEVSDEDLKLFYKLLKRPRRPHSPVPLRYGLSEEEIARIAVNEFKLQGVEVGARLMRHYPERELFSHVVGYVGRISPPEMSRFDEETERRYRGTHSIGKTGLEKYYENQLLGTVGSESGETNAHGRWLRQLERKNPLPGKDLQLFIDSRLQRISFDSMAGSRGAVVAIDVTTGGILSMVSMPSFNPNLFVNGISHEEYNLLNRSRDLPLFNRTIQGQYSPGSTVKPIIGLAGLESELIDSTYTIRDPGFYQLPHDERLFREWKKGGHGPEVDLREAIVESCDVFFYKLADEMGVDRMHQIGKHFGLGNHTHIDTPSERRGIWPSRAWKRAVRGFHWFPGDSLNMSIGQGDVLVTPLQLALMTSTIASRGVLRKPRLVKSVDGVATESVVLGRYESTPEYWDYIISAMEGVVHSPRGTARNRAGKGIEYRMAGKTGTVQLVSIAQDAEYDSEKLAERNRDHALFIGFAPADNPQIAVAAIVENGESGSGKASPVVRKIVDAWFQVEKEKLTLSAK